MELIFGILILLGYILIVLLTRSLTTLFHEMGHAIMALMFTDGPVQVMVGTYGESSKGAQMKLGRLNIFFKLNLFDWNKGLCSHPPVTKLWQSMLIIIAGPIASLIISIPLIVFLLSSEFSDAMIALAAVFIGAAGLDFIANVNPFGRPNALADGRLVRSDGQQLRWIIKRLRLPNIFFDIERDLEDQKYDEVIRRSLVLIEQGNQPKAIYDVVISAYERSGQLKKALSLYKRLNEAHDLSYQDFYSVGKLYEQLNQSINAIRYFNHCIHMHHSDAAVLYDRGLSYIELGEYQKAKMDFDASIYHNSRSIKAYMKRGFAKLKLKDTDGAYQDLIMAKQQNNKLPYIYYYLGLYYEMIGQQLQAVEHFNLAKKLNIDYHGIDYKIHLAESKLP